MKIGILTYHRSHNYGAMLQAVGLLKVLQGMGNDVSFIDYWPKHQSDIYRLFDINTFKASNWKGKLAYIKYFVQTLIPKKIRRKHFNQFFKEQVEPCCAGVDTNFDVIFYGSDQIWREQFFGYGYNPVYFGKNNFKAKKHVSYAASMGKLPCSDVDREKVVSLVKGLDVVSVRESELKQFLEANGLSGIKQTLDPTFLLGRTEWEKIASRAASLSEPYLLLYDLQIDCFDRKKVREFARAKQLKVVEIVGVANAMPTETMQTVDGPYEFIGAIANASYVLTSSFHGLAFSIIFNKPFYYKGSDKTE